MTKGFLAGRVRRLRRRTGLTQRELADKSALDRSMISKIESGQRKNVSRRTLERLAEALETSVDSLLTPPSSDSPELAHRELTRKYDRLDPFYQRLVDLHLDFLLHLQTTGEQGEEIALIFASPEDREGLEEVEAKSIEAAAKEEAEEEVEG